MLRRLQNYIMTYSKLLIFRYDMYFRKKRFANKLLQGVKDEILSAHSFINSHIEHQKEEMDAVKAGWRKRGERVNEEYKKLKGYGYNGRRDYFDSDPDDDPDLLVLDIISEINRLWITSEDTEAYNKEIEEYLEEIEASENLLNLVNKISPMLPSLFVSRSEDIDNFFKQQECEILLNIPSVLDWNNVVDKAYFS